MTRDERLQALKARIEAGEYRVDARAVAEAVIERITVPATKPAVPAIVGPLRMAAPEPPPVAALAA